MTEAPTVFILSGDAAERGRLCRIRQAEGWPVEAFSSAGTFVGRCNRGISGCLLIDAQLPDALHLLQMVNRAGFELSAVMMTRRIPMAVAAMRAGAADVVEKPAGERELLDALRRARARLPRNPRPQKRNGAGGNPFAGLTSRQLQVLQRVLAGQPSKNIAADLGISRRTVESHRAVIMQRTGSRSLAMLARLAATSNWYGDFQ